MSPHRGQAPRSQGAAGAVPAAPPVPAAGGARYDRPDVGSSAYLPPAHQTPFSPNIIHPRVQSAPLLRRMGGGVCGPYTFLMVLVPGAYLSLISRRCFFIY